MKKVVNILHGLISDGDVIKDQPVYKAVLHPPEHLRLILHHAVGRHHNVLINRLLQLSPIYDVVNQSINIVLYVSYGGLQTKKKEI